MTVKELADALAFDHAFGCTVVKIWGRKEHEFIFKYYVNLGDCTGGDTVSECIAIGEQTAISDAKKAFGYDDAKVDEILCRNVLQFDMEYDDDEDDVSIRKLIIDVE